MVNLAVVRGGVERPVLPVLLLRASLSSEEAWRWPSSPGSAWRGAFGWALKRTVCAMGLRSCDGCMLAGSCLYPYAFNTAPPDSAAIMTRYESVPHPFTLHLGPLQSGWHPAGVPLHVYLTLIGVACRQAAFFIRALELAGEEGIGTRRTRFSLREVEMLDPGKSAPPRDLAWNQEGFRPPQAYRLIPEPWSGRARIRFLTPLRLKVEERMLTPAQFAPAHVLSSLVRRISMLMYFHTDAPLVMDFAQLKEAASRVTAGDVNLRWQDMTRHSSRQGANLQMGGICGEAIFDFAAAPELWPFLRLGELVQAGKGTSMGLGLYSLETSP